MCASLSAGKGTYYYTNPYFIYEGGRMWSWINTYISLIWRFPARHGGTPIAGWFIVEEDDNWGYPHFRKASFWWNEHPFASYFGLQGTKILTAM